MDESFLEGMKGKKAGENGLSRRSLAKMEEKEERVVDLSPPLPLTYFIRQNLGEKFETDVNVVLVGNMGVGKSTLGNYLFNMGEKNAQLFQTSADPTTSCSKIAKLGSFVLEFGGKKVRMNLMDTPGLAELNPSEDLRHTIGLFEEVMKMGSVNMVVLVAGLQNRFDRQTVNTMQYFKSLFQPVFDCGNVCLAIPNYSQRRLDEVLEEVGEDMEVEEAIIDPLSKWRDECESRLGIKLAACRFFESRTMNHIRKMELAKFRENKPSGTVDRMSIESRNMFLMQMIQSKGVSLEAHTFPLPPVIEEMRRTRLEKVQEHLTEVTTKISLQTQLHSEKFESLTKQSKDIVNKLLEVSVLEEEITRLSGTIRSGSVYCDGNDRVCVKKNSRFSLWADTKNYILNTEKWNCQCLEESTEPQDGKTLISVQITPDFFNIRSRRANTESPLRKWYCKVWAEWEGTDSNKELIENKKRELELARRNAQLEQDELENAQQSLVGVSEDVKLFLEQQNSLREELILMSKERYGLKEACQAISIFAGKEQEGSPFL